MADMTVTLETLELALAQLTLLVHGADHIQPVETLELVLTLYSLLNVISFPGLSRRPSHTFSDEPSDKAVVIGSTASGYPVLNKQFTFDGHTFMLELRSLSEADKLTVMAFYEQHKDVPFPWYNEQDDTIYEVCFTEPPKCRMDGRKDLWRIRLNLFQTTP